MDTHTLTLLWDPDQKYSLTQPVRTTMTRLYTMYPSTTKPNPVCVLIGHHWLRTVHTICQVAVDGFGDSKTAYQVHYIINKAKIKLFENVDVKIT